jgi:hypothetical protein
LLVNGAGAALVLTIAWVALSQQHVPTTIRSASLTLSAAGAALLILTAIGGWSIGLFGTFGHGPIRVGWVTVASTVILVVSAAWSAVRNRRRSDVASEGPKPATNRLDATPAR